MNISMMKSDTTVNNNESKNCRRCGYNDCDISVKGCGCLFHTRCISPVLIINDQSCNKFCPGCKKTIHGFTLFPLNFGILVNEIESKSSVHSVHSVNTKRKRDQQKHLFENRCDDKDETSFSPFLHWDRSSVIGESDRRHFRVGRWTPGETFFVDELIRQFNSSSLPLPKGIKLNEFLRDVLMCKNSRLTKKMKSAKLSSRSYDHGIPTNPEYFSSLSIAQDSFLASTPSENTRNILRFNLQWIWRMNFSNLCLQVGYDSLDSKDWLLSLEELESRVSCASETFRQVRRRKMEVALRQDTAQESVDGVYLQRNLGSIPGFATREQLKPNVSSKVSVCSSSIVSDDTPSTIAFPKCQELRDISVLHNESINDEMSVSFLSLFDEEDTKSCATQFNESTYEERGPFVSRILEFVEERNFPFHYVDLWVPCCPPDEGGPTVNPDSLESLRLVHAGDGIVHELVSNEASQLLEFGDYSKKFSFGYGAGMPGRVYASGQYAWEGINESNESQFKRITGARVFGIKTVVGIAIPSTTSHQVVVGLYSFNEISRDNSVIEQCKEAFQYFDPKPKWSLMIDCLPTNKAEGNVVSTSASRITNMYKVQDSIIEKVASEQKAVEEMTLLLAEHMPIDQSDDTSLEKELNAFISLRLFLLRSQSGCSDDEIEARGLLIKSYEGYRKVKRDNSDIASLLIKDWSLLVPSCKMTYVNYDPKISQPRIGSPQPLSNQ